MIRALHLEAHNYPEEALLRLRQLGPLDCEWTADKITLADRLRQGQHHALIVALGIEIDRELLEASRSLRWVLSPTTGLSHIDLAAADDLGIRVISLQDLKAEIYTVSATAELTWGLLLSLARKINTATSSVLGGEWNRQAFVGSQLAGKTLGVVGFGRLGKMVATYGNAFGMTVIATEESADAIAGAPSFVSVLDEDEALLRSDVLSIHLPLNETTAGWLDADRIGRLKRGAFVVNTARGELCDETAMVEAIRNGHVSGFATDVLHGDPVWTKADVTSPVLAGALEGLNILITPHIGGMTEESIAYTRALIVERFVAEIS